MLFIFWKVLSSEGTFCYFSHELMARYRNGLFGYSEALEKAEQSALLLGVWKVCELRQSAGTHA
jgi:hypothetical protein